MEGEGGHRQERNLHWYRDPAFLPQTLLETPAKFTGAPASFSSRNGINTITRCMGTKWPWNTHSVPFSKSPREDRQDFGLGWGALKIKRTPLAPRFPGGWEGSEIRGNGSSVHQLRMWKCSWGWEGAP